MQVKTTLVNWLKDIFYDSTNSHLDNGRCVAYFTIAVITKAVLWNMHLHKEIDLGALSTGLAAVLGAMVIYIYHDRKTNGTE